MSATVLVIDDELHIRKLLCRMLDIAGFQVLEANGGHQALEIIERTPPDIITCDISMPEMDGFAVIKTLRENAATRHIPVVVITAVGQQDKAQRAKALGANDFITKPFSHASLIDTLHNQLSLA